MAASNPNSPEILRNEILADARRENREQTQAEAARRRELILTTVAVEAGRLRSARLESWLQAIQQATRQKLQARDGFDYRETVIALAAEALSRMTGDAFVVKLSQADGGTLGNGLAEEIGRHVGRSLTVTIAAEPTINDGGPIIQDRNGTQIWDNRFLSRLERLWPELRRQIAVATLLVPRSGTSGGGA